MQFCQDIKGIDNFDLFQFLINKNRIGDHKPREGNEKADDCPEKFIMKLEFGVHLSFYEIDFRI